MDKLIKQQELEIIKRVSTLAPRLMEGPNFLYQRALTVAEMRAHENYLGDQLRFIKIEGKNVEVSPIPAFGNPKAAQEHRPIDPNERVWSAVTEFIVQYADVSRYKRQRHWTHEHFYIPDPFISSGFQSNEMIALSIFSDLKALKCRILYGFTEAPHEGVYLMDALSPERLITWANAMLLRAVQVSAHYRIGEWFVISAKTVELSHSEIDLYSFKRYIEGLEIDMFYEEHPSEDEEEDDVVAEMELAPENKPNPSSEEEPK